MFFKMMRLLPIMVLNFTLVSNNVLAQANEDLDSLVSDTKSDLLVVVGGGLAGAVLGLSTLSFVEEPKDHTNNIVVGASIGIIAGVAFVAFSQANKTQDLLYGNEEEYEEQALIQSIKSFDTNARVSWHDKNFKKWNSFGAMRNQLNYKINF